MKAGKCYSAAWRSLFDKAKRVESSAKKRYFYIRDVCFALMCDHTLATRHSMLKYCVTLLSNKLKKTPTMGQVEHLNYNITLRDYEIEDSNSTSYIKGCGLGGQRSTTT